MSLLPLSVSADADVGSCWSIMAKRRFCSTCGKKRGGHAHEHGLSVVRHCERTGGSKAMACSVAISHSSSTVVAPIPMRTAVGAGASSKATIVCASHSLSIPGAGRMNMDGATPTRLVVACRGAAGTRSSSKATIVRSSHSLSTSSSSSMDIDGAVRRLVVRECSVDATAKVLEVGEVGGFATLARLEVRVGKRPDSAIAKGDGGVYSRPTRKMGRLSAVVDARMMAIMRKKWMGRSGWAGWQKA